MKLRFTGTRTRARAVNSRPTSDVRAALLERLATLDEQASRFEARVQLYLETEGVRPKRVLVVGDNKNDQRAFEWAIRSILQDVEIETTTFGYEALGRLKEGVYDAVLVDMNLPDIDGITIVQEIRSATLCPLVPILVISGELEGGELGRIAITTGATAAAEKPVMTSVLRSFLETHVAQP